MGLGAVVQRALRQHWRLVALVVLVGSIGAVLRAVGPLAEQPTTYVASATMRVLITPTGAVSAYASYRASQEEAALARAVASGGVLATQPLDDAIAAQLRLDHAAPVLVPSAVAANLSATHSGNIVTLHARGPTAAAATALRAAALKTLASGGWVAALPASVGVSAGTDVHFQVEDAVQAPTPDGARGAALWPSLLLRILLSGLVGLCLALAAAWLLPAQRLQPAPRP